MEKIQKILARAGVASRREIERWIAAGRVTVNGQLASLGDRADIEDAFAVDGKPIGLISNQQPARVLLYHKPNDEICSRHDPENRSTVFAHLPPLSHGRWIVVGRLDLTTTGVLLFTNDGDLANHLMHPSNQIIREYAVRVLGKVTPSMLAQLRQGVELDDGPAKFDNIAAIPSKGANQWFRVTLTRGKNHEVKRLWQAVGVKVSRLMRVRFAGITLPRTLKAGQWKELTRAEVKRLQSS